MDSTDLARYIEATDSLAKPWLLLQLRLKKLQERRAELAPADYLHELSSIHAELMALGEWWVGREAEEFGSPSAPDTAAE